MEKKTVLVIEDNALNMKLVRSLLQLGGYQIFEASDAERAIQMAHNQPPDLILMDFLLPGMNGLSAIHLLKDTPQLQHIPTLRHPVHTGPGRSRFLRVL